MSRNDHDRHVDLLTAAARLKALPRTGWLLRGVASPESVAAHGFGTAFTAMVLLELVEEPLDRERTLAMAILHDLPESILGDIPTPAARHLPAGAKDEAETAVFEELITGLPLAERWRGLWREFATGETPEARLVRDADKLEMFLQVMLYERAGNRDVREFWSRVEQYSWSFEVTRELLKKVDGRRP